MSRVLLARNTRSHAALAPGNLAISVEEDDAAGLETPIPGGLVHRIHVKRGFPPLNQVFEAAVTFSLFPLFALSFLAAPPRCSAASP